MIPLHDTVPTRRRPVVTLALIGANVAVWLLYQLPDLPRSVADLGFRPCEVVGSCAPYGASWPVNALTAMFLHGDWLHLLGNMLFLWIFGNNVEDAMGRARYLVFYVLAGLIATALQTWVTLTVGSPGEGEVPMVGASGAIAGVLGAYFFLLPLARVVVLVLLPLPVPIEVPALVFLGFWFLFQLWQGGFSLVAADSVGGIAFFAHVGGFAFGLAAARAFAPRRRPRIAGPW
ncbi:MAG: rhomboid family intramembrane serine protease [Thermoleophilia bacterium]|nr:rhomboid family intramembrane serine protease [Gaiellaceae bacterium]MDW8337652.1 rhomboid family intramembrane serine protease [Thermoleophilia bacterium]